VRSARPITLQWGRTADLLHRGESGFESFFLVGCQGAADGVEQEMLRLDSDVRRDIGSVKCDDPVGQLRDQRLLFHKDPFLLQLAAEKNNCKN
jgi:hypothetical protein